MAILSVGRSLLMRQVLLAGVVMALGAFAYVSVRGIEDQLQALTTADSNVSPLTAAAILVAARDAAWHILMAAAGTVIVMIAFSAYVVHSALSRPLKALAEATGRLVEGDYAAAIEGEERHDEIGVIARGLSKLRDAAADRGQPRRRSPAGLATETAKQGARALGVKIEAFARDLGQQVQRLGSMTRRLGEAADGMIVAARHANDGSDQATTASSNAAGDVSSVATASEQLLDSIEEISRQVVQSTNVVKTAVERAVETNSGMGRLSTAAQKVGDVVSLISRIAAQTNLLALNATIEAARAGEAGRGFAVVAQEVKTLATQTAKATQDITGQIAEMQQATDLSVDAIDKIQKKISEVEHISTIISAAVHEQGAATQEIARNVRSAAAGTASMSSHIENVVRSVGETSTSASSVASLARDLDEIAKGHDRNGQQLRENDARGLIRTPLRAA